MPEELLTILKLCLLALLYLFFLRVLRAVWVEVRTEGADVARRSGAGVTSARTQPSGSIAAAAGQVEPSATPRDVMVTDAHGQQRGPIAIGSVVTVGRADTCEIPIDDTFASQMHARIFGHDGVVYLEDLGSTNRTFLNETKVGGTAPLRTGDLVVIGNTRLELR